MVNDVAISPDDKLLASCDGIWQRKDEPGEVKLWDLATRKELPTLGDHLGCVSSVAFSPDGKTLATGSADKTIKLYDVIWAEARK
jgi:WD40 repeat protein